MSEVKELRLKRSELKAKLLELGQADSVDEAAVKATMNELQGLEVRERALLAGQPDDEKPTETATEKPEDREYRELMSGATLADLVEAVEAGRGVEGRMREVQQHHNLTANAFPLDMLSAVGTDNAGGGADRHGEVEERAATVAPTGGVQANQADVLPFIFPASAAAWLSVWSPMVASGDSVYPVMTNSANVQALAPGADTTETTGTVTSYTLSPQRLSASFSYRAEDRLRFASLDSMLRMNIRESLMDQLDQQVLAANSNGLLASGTLTPGTAGSAAATYGEYLDDLAYESVDGTYADQVGQVRLLMGTATYRKAGSVLATNTAVSALDRLMTLTNGVRVSTHIPAPASNVQVVLCRRGMRRDFVVPIWRSVELIADRITRAGRAEVKLTASMHFNCRMLRSEGFRSQNVRLSS